MMEALLEVGKYLQRRVSYDELVRRALIEALTKRARTCRASPSHPSASWNRACAEGSFSPSTVHSRRRLANPDRLCSSTFADRSFTQDDTTTLVAKPRWAPGHKQPKKLGKNDWHEPVYLIRYSAPSAVSALPKRECRATWELPGRARTFSRKGRTALSSADRGRLLSPSSGWMWR